MNGDQKRAILEEIVELSMPPRRRPTDVTVKDLVEACNVSEKKAYDILMDMAERPGWTTTKVLHDAHWIRVLRKENECDEDCTDTTV